MLDQRLSTIPQHHWISKLFGYDFRVEYRAGSLNTVTDALSRRDGDDPLLSALLAQAPALAAISVPTFHLFEDLRREVSSSDELRSRRDDVTAGAHGAEWRVQDGLILFKGRVFMPSLSAVLDDVLQLAHTAAHEGIQKTLHRLRTEFFVEHDRRVVRDFVLTCTTCQRNKMEALHPPGLL
jgi:hypothetical protein